MLVEGGYLHSMKQIIENATEPPERKPQRAPRTGTLVTSRHPGALARSLRRLKIILLGSDPQR